MLSAAKHLLYLLESKQKQILRFAQNDVLRAFFSTLLGYQQGLDGYLDSESRNLLISVSCARGPNPGASIPPCRLPLMTAHQQTAQFQQSPWSTLGAS
jgi:hypothetical protein